MTLHFSTIAEPDADTPSRVCSGEQRERRPAGSAPTKPRTVRPVELEKRPRPGTERYTAWTIAKTARRSLEAAGLRVSKIIETESGSRYFTAYPPGDPLGVEVRISDHDRPFRNHRRKLPIVKISWLARSPLRGLKRRVLARSTVPPMNP